MQLLQQIAPAVDEYAHVPPDSACDSCGEPVNDADAAVYHGGWVVCHGCADAEEWPWGDDIPHRNGDYQCAEETVYVDDPA